MKKLLTDFLDKKSNLLGIVGIFLVSVTFFYRVIIFGYIPLPLDALVGAHLPWVELKWKEYPAGVPIKNLEITDAISQFYPWRSITSNFWRAGELPLWNEYMFSGAPFLATLHSAALYPLNFLYLLFSDSQTWTFLIFLQIFLSGLFCYFFLRGVEISSIVSLCGSIAFAFSGYMIAWLEFGTGGQAGLWLPILLLLEYKLVKTGKKVFLGLIGITFFFIFTAGDFQVPFYITFAYLFFGAFVTIQNYSEISSKIKVYTKIFSGLILGFLLSAIQLLPTVDLYRKSIRSDDPYIQAVNFGLMDWSKIVNFIWPDFYGNVVTGNYWGRFGFHEYLAFSGVISIVFLIYSFLTRKKNIEVIFWWLLFLSLLLLFPTPIGYLPYLLKIPGLGTSSASRIIFLVDFCIVVLFSFGLEKWLKKTEVRINKIAIYLLSITFGVVLGIVISLFYFKENMGGLTLPLNNNLKVSLRNIIPGTLILMALLSIITSIKSFKFLRRFNNRYFFSFCILLLVIVEMLYFGWKNTPFSPKKFLFPTTTTLDFLKSQEKPFRIAGPGLPLNYFIMYDLGSAEGYDPLYPLNNAKWFSAVNYGHLEKVSRRYGEITNFASPLIDYANIKYVIDYRKNAVSKMAHGEGEYSSGLISAKFKEVFSEGRVKVFENLSVLPKTFLTRDYEIASSEADLVK